LKTKDKLVLAAVERAHPGIILDPDAEVLPARYKTAAEPAPQQFFPTWRQSMQDLKWMEPSNATGRQVAQGPH